jgi:hypothetical protein
LTANSDRLSHFAHRISLLLQTLILQTILFREQEHRQERTNRTLKEAIRLYRGAGYVEVEAFNAEPYAHHWFEKRLARFAVSKNELTRLVIQTETKT